MRHAQIERENRPSAEHSELARNELRGLRKLAASFRVDLIDARTALADSAALASLVVTVLSAVGWKVGAADRDLVILGGIWPVEPALVRFGPIPPGSALRSLPAARTHRCAGRLDHVEN